MSAAILASVIAWLDPAGAEEDSLESLLSESIESTSGKAAGTAHAAPALSINVTAEDLRRYGIRTLDEAYNFLILGLVAQDPLGDPEIGSRGVLFSADNGKHVLLLLDGHTLNDQARGASVHGHGFGIPIELIDHVEVMLGPGSVLYGANAMFGVINVITKRAKDFRGIHLVAEAAFSPPLNRARQPLGPAALSPYFEHLGQAYRVAAGWAHEFSLANERADITLALEYYTLDGPTMAWGPSESPQSDFGPRGTFGVWGGRTSASHYEQTPAAYARLVVGKFEAFAHAVTSRLSSPYVRFNDRPLDSTEFDDPDAYRDRQRLALELKWQRNLSEVASVAARAYGDVAGESYRLHQRAFFGCFEPFVPQSYRRCELSSSNYARWVGSELQLNLDWMRNRKLVTLLGADARVRRVGYENQLAEPATGQVQRFSQVDRDERAGAPYFQQVYKPTPWLTLNAGARWDFDSEYGNRVSPRVAVIAEPWRGGTVKAIYAEALRAPTMDERTYRDPQRVLPSNALEAESVRSLELVLSEQFGAQSIVFGLFRSWWSNMIFRHRLDTADDPTPDSLIIQRAQQSGVLTNNIEYAFQYRNMGSLDNWGLNAGWEGALVAGRLTYALNVTAAHARSEGTDEMRSLTVTPSWFGNARVSFDLEGKLPTLALATHFGGKRLADVGQEAAVGDRLYAPASFDLRTTATGPFPGVGPLSYRLMVDYSFASETPFSAEQASEAEAELVPENRFTALFGLQLRL